MKALVFHGARDIRHEEVETPVLQDGEALVRVRASGICGSDLHAYSGKSDRRTPPMIMGHEFAGEIAELGSGVSGFKKDDRVVVQPLLFCGECDMCLEGLTSVCRKKSLFGVFSKNGAMAEYVAVPQRQLLALPPSMPFVSAALMEPLAVAYSAVVKAVFPAGRKSKVVVVGCGAIGLCAIKLVKAMADAEVMAFDTLESRLETARIVGADHCVNSGNESFKAEMENAFPQGADIAFEAVGFGSTVKLAMESLGLNGQCVWIGNSAKSVEVNMQDIVVKMKGIKGSYAYTHKDFQDVLKLAVEKGLDLSALVSKVADMSEGAEMFRRLEEGRDGLIKVILSN